MTQSVLARAFLLAAVAASAAGAQTGAPLASVSYRVIRSVALGDTLNANVVNANAVVYNARTSQSFASGGAYRVRWSGDAFGVLDNKMLRLAPAGDFQTRFDADLGSRPVAGTTLTSETLRALPNFPGGTSGTRPLIAASVPFEMIGANGVRAELVMFQRHTPGSAGDSLDRNSRLIGTRGDTVRVSIPANAWMPGDTLYVIETVGATRMVTLAMVLECAASGEPRRTTCNPLALGTTGATGYLPLAKGYESVWRVPAPAQR